MEENRIVHNYLYLGLEWPYAMILFTKYYLVPFSKCDAYYVQNIMTNTNGGNKCK